jgi:glycerophosphoryl diester phosphodiesterase
MLLYAHRGSSGVAPENTLLAFARAVADGADGVELDVRATADGVPVVLHDRDLGRTTDGAGRVDELSLAELKRFDAGTGERVPTLAEVLDLLAGRLRLDLELKQRGIERAVLAVLGGHPEADWAISSFDWGALRRVRDLAPSADLWPIAIDAGDDLFATARELEASAVALPADVITAEVAARCAGERLRVMAWPVNDAVEARRLRELGVAALCTDVPAAIRRGLDDPAGT